MDRNKINIKELLILQFLIKQYTYFDILKFSLKQ